MRTCSPIRPSAGQVVPPSALALEGKKIFIKGYIYPGREKDGIRQFLLVRDQGDCCFGGNPKITDRIQVTLDDPLTADLRVRGCTKWAARSTWKSRRTTIDGAKGGVYYHLRADHLQ